MSNSAIKKQQLIYDAADTYSTSSNEAFEKTLEAIGVEVLTVETFQTGDTDFSTQLTNIMRHGSLIRSLSLHLSPRDDADYHSGARSRYPRHSVQLDCS